MAMLLDRIRSKVRNGAPSESWASAGHLDGIHIHIALAADLGPLSHDLVSRD